MSQICALMVLPSIVTCDRAVRVSCAQRRVRLFHRGAWRRVRTDGARGELNADGRLGLEVELVPRKSRE